MNQLSIRNQLSDYLNCNISKEYIYDAELFEKLIKKLYSFKNNKHASVFNPDYYPQLSKYFHDVSFENFKLDLYLARMELL